VAQVTSIKEQLQTLEKAIVSARRQRKDALEECERIEKEMAEFNSDKGSKLKEMQQKITSLKSEISKDSSKIKNMQRDVQTLKMELGRCQHGCFFFFFFKKYKNVEDEGYGINCLLPTDRANGYRCCGCSSGNLSITGDH
jgi:DNA repair exonuclease SbcCD ATPase subunit